MEDSIEVTEPIGPPGGGRSIEEQLQDLQAQFTNNNSLMSEALSRCGVALGMHRDLEAKYEVSLGMHRDLEAKYEVSLGIHRNCEAMYDDLCQKFDAIMQRMPAYEMDHLYYGGRNIRVLAGEILRCCADGTRGRQAFRNVEDTAMYRDLASLPSTPMIERVSQPDSLALRTTFHELVKTVIVSRHATAHYDTLQEMENAVHHALSFIARNQVYCDTYLGPQAWVVNHFYFLKSEFGFSV